MVNRSAVTLCVKQPFYEWLRSLPNPVDLTIEEVNREPQVYLLPDYAYESDKEGLLAECCDALFEEQLEAWWTVETDWPEGRDLTLFRKWFDVEFHSVVLDLVDAPLFSED